MENKPLWTITGVLEWTKQYFANKGIENPRLDAEILLCAVLKCERITLYVHFDQPLSEEELTEYRGYVARRAQQEPLAYILGEKAFMKHSFKVNPAVLVPRPETELLVESVAKAAAGAGAASLLDLGTGSGAIIVSLLELLPQAAGTAVDISAAALAVAGENAEAICRRGRLLISSCPIRLISRQRILPGWLPMCSGNRGVLWTAVVTDWIFTGVLPPGVGRG